MMHGGIARIAETSDEQAKDRSQVALRLIRMAKPYWVLITVSFLLILVSAAAQAVGPLLIGLAVDRFIVQGDRSGLLQSMLALTGVYLLSMFAMRYQIYFLSLAGQKVLADMRRKIITHIEKLSLQYLESKDAGDLMSRLVNDIEAINAFLGQGLTQSIGSLFAILGIVIAMLLLDYRLGLASLAIIPVMFFTTGQFARVARRAFRKTRSTIGDVSAEMQEELGGIKVAQAFNRSDVNVRRFAERNKANRDANVSANAVTSAFAPAMDVLSTLDTAIVAGYGGWLAVQGLVSVGTVVAFLQYVQNFFRPIQTVAQIYTMAQSALAAAERVFELLDTEPQIQDALHAVSITPIAGEVVFEQVTFQYQDDKPVLENISLRVEPGQTIALVGPTGAGKSTLVNLILRFYDVQQGRILIDGTDIRQINQENLRSQMGVVPQEAFLFSGSILENIRYGRLDASVEDIEAAARIANAHEFILRLPQGYETQVGERGGMLSQGQRQLISIARAVLADPRILILDEATASVDTHTEVLIQRALNKLLKGRTSFVIAHRLATVRNADAVLVIDQGAIVESGTHAELLKKGGLYAELYNRQFVERQPELA